MRPLIMVFAFITTTIYGQVSDDLGKTYSLDYVVKYVKKNKMSSTLGTKEIVSEITREYTGEEQQAELIKFYSEAYDYKIVNKSILKKLVDSLAIHGMSDEVKSFAAESIQLVEYRLLDKTIRDFEFLDKDGALVRLGELREKIVIIELWATWCAPCIQEMRKIPALRKQNPNIEFYSISLDKSHAKMKKFVVKNGYDWPIVFGGDQEVNKSLWDYMNIVAIPKYYTVDRDGVVINVADHLDEQYIKSLK